MQGLGLVQGSGLMSRVRIGTFILKAHVLEWAFGFGHYENILPDCSKQENSPIDAGVTTCHHFIRQVVTK